MWIHIWTWPWPRFTLSTDTRLDSPQGNSLLSPHSVRTDAMIQVLLSTRPRAVGDTVIDAVRKQFALTALLRFNPCPSVWWFTACFHSLCRYGGVSNGICGAACQVSYMGSGKNAFEGFESLCIYPEYKFITKISVYREKSILGIRKKIKKTSRTISTVV